MSWKIRATLSAIFVPVMAAAIYDHRVNHNPDAAVGIVMSALGLLSWGALALLKWRETPNG